MTELTKFDFQGDELDVLADGDRLWVSIRRVCDALGVAMPRQLEKLRKEPAVFCVHMMCMQMPGDDQRRDIAMIELHSLPLWLATIHASKVSPSVQAKLVAYKRECADVLADHFLGKRGGDSTVIVDALKAQLQAQEARSNARLQALEQQIFALTYRTIEAAKPSIGPGAARTYILDPLKEIARVRARSIGKSSASATQSLRASAERALRRELAFPPDRNMRWELFPASRLGEACCVLARMHGDALELARVAAGNPKQQRLALVRA